MNGKWKADAGWGLGGALLLNVVMITLAFAWVAFYAYVVEPGHDRAFYEAYAGRSSPAVSLIAGGPVFFLFALWLAHRRGGGRAAWIAVFIYLLTDLAIIAGTDNLEGTVGLIFFGGAVIKVAGTALGVKRAKR